MNNILDYEQVIDKLKNLASNNIIENSPIGYSTFGLPISHYTFGSGKKNIVVSGATHGSEIISTDFVLKLMEHISDYIDSQNCTIHFFPMLNPEGYLISTSAIRQIIPRDMEDSYAQTIIDKYTDSYNAHDLSYQKIFEDVDYTCISKKYDSLRNNIKDIYEKYNIPNGTLQVWSANGNGIDLNQNCPYNNKMKYLKDNKNIYGNNSYKNILITQPGPIGCPSKTSNFEYEPETKCFMEFLLDLKHTHTLCGYLNYHSAEDTIFYKPLSGINPPEMIANIDVLTKYNEEIARLYSSNSTQNLYNGDTIYYCFNDMLRLQIPGDVLIELCPIEGNPLSAYNYKRYNKTISDNLKATICTISNLPDMYEKFKKQLY